MTSSTRSTRAPVLGVSLGLIALLTALIAAFTWPLSQLEPRDLPVAVAGPPEAVTAVEDGLARGEGDPDALAITGVEDRDAAVAAIEDREVYGAIVAGPTGPAELLVASAASPIVARMLTEQVSGQVSGQGSQVPVTDVVPSAEGDPQGVIFGAGALPLAIGGLIVGAATSLALRRTRDRVSAALVISVGGGLAMTGVLWGWLDALGGSYWADAGVIALGVLAVALPIIGLRHLIGPAGIGVVAALILLVGNPLSGVTSAAELLPLGWLGQLMPPGAVGTGLRGTAFFDGAGIGVPLTVLAAWAIAGLACALVPRREAQAVAADQG